jgi:hypothetical protein
MRNGGIAPLFLTLVLVEVSGQIHAAVALSSGKQPPIPT